MSADLRNPGTSADPMNVAALSDTPRPNRASTITPEQKQAIADRLLTGDRTDEIPECMSWVIGRWIMSTQDAAPPEYCRDNLRWRELLPLAAGTGRELEAGRLQLILDWMWDVLALPAVVAAVPDPAKSAWAEMLEERTADAAAWADAAWAAWAAADAAAWAADAAWAAFAAADAAAWAACAVGPGLWPDVDPIGLFEQLITVGLDAS